MKPALIKLHLSVFLWGFTGVLGRLITLNEGLLVWYRILITLVILFLFIGFSKTEGFEVSGKKIIRLFFIGIIVALHWVCFYGSIKYSNVSIALTCLSAAGLITSFFEPLFFNKRISLIEVALGLCGIAGILLIFHFDPKYQTGIIIGIIATVLSVLFSILNKKMVEHTRPATMMFYELLGGFIMLSILMPWYLNKFSPTHIFPTEWDWFWLGLLSVFCTVLAMILSLQALKSISVFTQNLTLNLEPVYGILLAFMVYKENKELSNGFYWGLSIIILAVMIQMWRMFYSNRKKKRKPSFLNDY